MHAGVEVAPQLFGADKLAPETHRGFPLRLSKPMLAGACLFLTGVLGYIDYLTGYEQSFLLFYLLPIALATWFGNIIFN